MSDRLTYIDRMLWEERSRQARIREEQANRCLVQSLKGICFAIGGTHVAGWVEEAERAARQGRVVKHE